MRPPVPATYRRGLFETLGVERFVPMTARMVVRNLERSPFRALLSVMAIALAVAIVIVGVFAVDSIHYLADIQFNTTQRQDVTVVFKEIRSRRALLELGRMPGVIRAEPVRVVPVWLRHAQRSRRIGLVGVPKDATLARVVDERLRGVALPPAGVVLNDALAGVLHVERGDVITIDVLEGARPVRTAVVADIVSEPLGLSAYMDLDAVNRLMREGTVLSGAHLHIDTAQATALYTRLKRTPGIGGVTLTNVARRSFEETVAAVVTTVTNMFAIFGAAIAFAVIYNNSRIAFAERARELGSLHVLGFSHAEMAEVLLGETLVLTCVALPIGVLAGRLLGALVVVVFSTELARIPLVISPATNAFAVSITVASAALSAVATWRQLIRLDIIGVLKAPE
jgi:putative ABC transport system permease protein